MKKLFCYDFERHHSIKFVRDLGILGEKKEKKQRDICIEKYDKKKEKGRGKGAKVGRTKEQERK